MKRINLVNLLEKCPIYSSIIPLTLVLYIIQTNIKQELIFTECLFLCAVIVLCIIFIQLIAKALLREALFSGFMIAVFFVLFISYTNIYNTLLKILGYMSNLLCAVILTSIFLLFVFLGLLVKSKKKLGQLTIIINLFSIVFLGIGISGIVMASGRDSIVYNERNQTAIISTANDYLPDIYYFIFDTMLNLETAETYFEANTGNFKVEMEKLGFEFYDNAGYEGLHLTISSLASLFNPTEYDQVIHGIMTEYSSIGYKPETDYIKTQSDYFYRYANYFESLYMFPEFFLEMKAAGYTIVGIGADSNEPKSVLYDKYYPHNVIKNFNNNIYNIFFEATPLNAIFRRIWGHNVIPLSVFGDRSHNNLARTYKPYMEQVDYFKEDVLDIASLNMRPKLSICHILMPHFPFVFNADGKAEINPRSFSISRYKGQYEFTLSYIMEVISSLIGEDKDAIIIIQGDHGITENHLDMEGMVLSEEDHRAIGTQVFLSIYDPYKLPIEKDISALDVPRILMNEYAGTTYSLRSKLIN